MIHYIYPGKFKPVHDGHVYVISRMLADSDADLHVIISAKTKDNLGPEESLNFLNKLFGNNPNFSCQISSAKTPMIDAYDIVCTKAYGDGTYSLVASSKDPERSAKFADTFKEGSKYFTPGATVVACDPIPAFTMNDDEMSSTIARQAIAARDLETFKKCCNCMTMCGLVEPYDVLKYYEALCAEMHGQTCSSEWTPIEFPVNLTEGGAAGHMNHLHENDDMTFNEVFEFVRALFAGEIRDISEKLDGINIFASMADNGEIIFARNKGNLQGNPLHIGDIKNSRSWPDNVKSVFSKAADAIATTLQTISKDFFVYKMQDGITRRTWINFEILSTDTENIITYGDSVISVHGLVIADENGKNVSLYDDPNELDKLPRIESAMKDSARSTFKMQIDPKIIIKKSTDSIAASVKISNMIWSFLGEWGLGGNDTIRDFKEKAIMKYLNETEDFKFASDEVKAIIARRCLGERKRTDAAELKADRWINYPRYKKFEEHKQNSILRGIFEPLTKIFITIGNKAINLSDGLKNENRKDSAIDSINKKLIAIIDNTEASDDENFVDDILDAFSKLETESINSSEGLVVKYKGKTFKLTGTFLVLSRLFNIARRANK